MYFIHKSFSSSFKTTVSVVDTAQRNQCVLLKSIIVVRGFAYKAPYAGIKEIRHHRVKTGDDECGPIHIVPHLSKRNSSDHPVSAIL